ncbi:siderophore-interacting protein [Agreia pratensis]|uniref:siderophore-interacting protein n=1 Tax=Agreia pratensis TaxID=150121 RepID=UPI00188BC980|nr:siderophore-interacting protein [Agreia pratensis]MBF4633696.1 siderophore-interacting protein [Agreia pratensis]
MFAQTPTAPFHLHRVRVSAIRDLSPSFRRFTLTGDHLNRFADNGFDQRIKLILPLDQHGLDPVPMHDEWYNAWRELPDDRRNPLRTYTVRAVRQSEREIDVDVVVHDVAGPASRWAEEATVGSEIVVLGPNEDHDGPQGGVDFLPPPHAERILLAGDETAVPAIASILERLDPSARGEALVEVPFDADAVCLPRHPGISVRVLGRNGRAPGALLIPAVTEIAPALLENTDRSPAGEIDDVDIDEGLLWEVPSDQHGGPAQQTTPLYAWLAGEASVIKALRRHLVGELGMDRKAVAFMGYWRLGRKEN